MVRTLSIIGEMVYNNIMKILLTGASGTIGSELGEQLRHSGHYVAGVDRKPLQNDEAVDKFYNIDLLDKFAVSQLPGDFDLVIHLAANARVYNLVVNPDLNLENVTTIHNVFEHARRFGIPKILMASSREVYGNQEKLPVEEGRSDYRFSESPYASGKIFGESYAYSYAHVYGIDTKIVRFSNVYGKWDTSDRFIPKLMSALNDNREFQIYGEKKSMSFTYIDDCVSGTLAVLDNWDRLPKEINVASDSQNKLLDVAKMAKEMVGSTSEITLGNNLPGEVWNYQADVSVLKTTGWMPKVSIEEGILKSIQWYIGK